MLNVQTLLYKNNYRKAERQIFGGHTDDCGATLTAYVRIYRQGAKSNEQIVQQLRDDPNRRHVHINIYITGHQDGIQYNILPEAPNEKERDPGVIYPRSHCTDEHCNHV